MVLLPILTFLAPPGLAEPAIASWARIVPAVDSIASVSGAPHRVLAWAWLSLITYPVWHLISRSHLVKPAASKAAQALDALGILVIAAFLFAILCAEVGELMNSRVTPHKRAFLQVWFRGGIGFCLQATGVSALYWTVLFLAVHYARLAGSALLRAH